MLNDMLNAHMLHAHMLLAHFCSVQVSGSNDHKNMAHPSCTPKVTLCIICEAYK